MKLHMRGTQNKMRPRTSPRAHRVRARSRQRKTRGSSGTSGAQKSLRSHRLVPCTSPASHFPAQTSGATVRNRQTRDSIRRCAMERRRCPVSLRATQTVFCLSGLWLIDKFNARLGYFRVAVAVDGSDISLVHVGPMSLVRLGSDYDAGCRPWWYIVPTDERGTRVEKGTAAMALHCCAHRRRTGRLGG